ncbi:trehalose operon repressor [Lactobacillus corticis]|uniref:Trehalose operon repressor n=1 Tax=Lactobacillus corticis TaxID=2201249 RepID=A0A916QKF1_9LACO|nr:trehalose operon repressor [Lactobacillus corticis]GFZ27582.1 GntR family transcriptional regulator [Lactobacillus corticis]
MESKQRLIAKDLLAKIKSGQYRPGDLLPGEVQLTELYGTSRETVRKALRHLVDLGLIQKVRGRGSVVLNLDRYKFPISGLTSFKELNASQGLNAETKVLVLEERPSPEYFMTAELTSEPATFIRRLRIINGEPDVVDEDFILKSVVPEIPLGEAANSLYRYFEDDLGLDISYATKLVTFEKAPQHVAKLLQVASVAVVRSMVYLQDTRLFQLTTSYHRPDKFEFSDFARRQKL